MRCIPVVDRDHPVTIVFRQVCTMLARLRPDITTAPRRGTRNFAGKQAATPLVSSNAAGCPTLEVAICTKFVRQSRSCTVTTVPQACLM
jgi:hypothetical protein